MQAAWPDILNSDQGAQFTAPEFTSTLQHPQIQISIDSRGRWLDNVFIEGAVAAGEVRAD